jgi:hypothetical protein
MAFDITTARKFDISTAKPVEEKKPETKDVEKEKTFAEKVTDLTKLSASLPMGGPAMGRTFQQRPELRMGVSRAINASLLGLPEVAAKAIGKTTMEEPTTPLEKGSALAGEVTGMVTGLPGQVAGRIANPAGTGGLLRLAGRGALGGAVEEAIRTPSDENIFNIKDRGKRIALGAAVGGVTNPVVAGVIRKKVAMGQAMSHPNQEALEK